MQTFRRKILAQVGRACLLGLLIIHSGLAASGADTPPLDNFHPAVGSIRSLLAQPDGKIVIGGSSFSIPGVGVTRIARLTTDGNLEPTFLNPYYFGDGVVIALVLQEDGKIIFAGGYGTLGRLTPEGAVDSTFAPTFFPPDTHSVRSVVVQPDGKILIGGEFTSINGVTLFRMARLNSNGSVDTAFTPHFTGDVNCLALQADSKCVVGGQFIQVNSVSRSRIARLNADGSLDQAFNPNVSGGSFPEVSAMAVQADGKVVLGGSFTTVGGQPRASIARVLSDGALDLAFDPGVTGEVFSVALQTDGRIVIGGTFTAVAGQPRQNLARLNPDGSLDPTFTVEARGTTVSAVGIQKDGKVLVGGFFTNLASVSCTNLGRLLPKDEPYEVWTRNADELIWLRGGGGPELCRARFEYSADGATWLPLGEGTRVPGGWNVSGLSTIPGDSAIRGTGYVRGSRHSGSGWWFQSTVNLTNVVPLRILSEDPSFGLTDHRLGFKISGPPGQPFRVETSSNLTDWTPIWTNTSSSNPVLFSDPQPAEAPHLFYRVRYQ